MRLPSFCLFSVCQSLISLGQFYPESRAYWWGADDNGGPPGFYVSLVMFPNPDTVINGTVYKKIQENNDASGSPEFIRNHFVRSDTSGKGYVYIPDSAAEFLTGDLNAQAGDTVQDVMVSITNESDIGYMLADVIVDSVVDILVSGNLKTRVYAGGNGMPHFWQEGMGIISGPMLEVSGQWWYCCVNDTVQYGSGPCPGWISDGIMGSPGLTEAELIRGPNHSDGLFWLAGEQARRFTVWNTQGRFILAGRSSAIDLTAQGPGMYAAVIETPHGNRTVRLFISR